MSVTASDHRATLDRALRAIDERTYWSAYPEHPKAYGDDAPAAGEAAFRELLGRPFELDQTDDGHRTVAESAPYGIELGLA